VLCARERVLEVLCDPRAHDRDGGERNDQPDGLDVQLAVHDQRDDQTSRLRQDEQHLCRPPARERPAGDGAEPERGEGAVCTAVQPHQAERGARAQRGVQPRVALRIAEPEQQCAAGQANEPEEGDRFVADGLRLERDEQHAPGGEHGFGGGRQPPTASHPLDREHPRDPNTESCAGCS
jgi:hypothetical protein